MKTKGDSNLFILLCGVLLGPVLPVHAYLGGFENGDGYSNSSYVGKPSTGGLGDNNVTLYNAGLFGTNNGGPGGSLADIPDDTGLWQTIQGGLKFGGDTNNNYLVTTTANEFSGSRALDFSTAHVSGTGVDTRYRYSFDSRDLNGLAVSTATNGTLIQSFWTCLDHVAGSPGAGVPVTSYGWLNSSGAQLFELGNDDNMNLIYRFGGTGAWTVTGQTFNTTAYDNVVLQWNLTSGADTLSASFNGSVLFSGHAVASTSYIKSLEIYQAADTNKSYMDENTMSFTAAPVPEPGGCFLAWITGLCLIMRRRRRA